MKINSFALFGVLLLLSSCTGIPVPALPGVKTKLGRDCLKDCQREHRYCSSACQGMLLEESKCLSQCNRILGDCYQLCRGEDRVTRGKQSPAQSL